MAGYIMEEPVQELWEVELSLPRALKDGVAGTK